MAEELYMSIKTDVKSATKETQDYTKSLQGAQGKVKEINEQLAVQNKYILEQEKELLKLKQAQDAIPKGAWSAQAPKLAEDIKKLTGEIKGEKLALKDLKLQQQEATGVVKEFNQAQKETGGSLMDDIKNFKVMGVSINGITGGFKKMIPVVKAAFMSIKSGLIATGIGAFIVAIGSLVAWFTKTKVGAEALSKVFAGVGAAVNVIVDRITGFVSAVGQLLSGDVSGGLSNMLGTFTGIGDEIVRETKAAVQLKEALNRLVDAERELSVETAQRTSQMEELRREAEDLNLTEEERIGKLEEAAAIEQDLANKRIANAEEAVRIQKEQMSMSENMKEDLQALADLEINLANVRKNSSKIQRTLMRRTNRLRKQAHDEEIRRINKRREAQNKITRENIALKKEVNAIVMELNNQHIIDSAVSEERGQRDVAQKMLKLENEANIEKIKNSKLTAEEKATAILRIEARYIQESDQLDKDYNENLRKRKQDMADELAVITNETTLKLIEDERKRGDVALLIQKQNEIAAVEGKVNEEELIAAIDDKYRLLRKEKKDAEAEEDKARAEAVAQTKQEILANGLAALGGILQFQMNDLEKQKKKEIKLAKKQGKDTQAIEEKFEAKRIAIAKKQKGLKIGMAVIDTYQSAISAYNAAMQLGPAGLALAPLSAAAAIAAGLANVAIISQQDVGGGGGGGGAAGIPGGGGGGAERPSEQFMGGGFELGEMDTPDPIKAFVVTDEMTSSQNQLANIRRRSTI
jgi:hypothetical protein